MSRNLTDIVHEDDLSKIQTLVGKIRANNGKGGHAEIRLKVGEGRVLHVLTSLSAVRDEDGKVEQFVVQAVDISSRQKAEEHLRQAQKMEAVGQLTGGIAHDFNNLLTVIIGNLQLVEGALEGNDKALKRAREAIDAACKGSELTKQLLAFARKQTIAPKVYDLNKIVEHMFKMLRHLIGEDIHITWIPQSRLWSVMIDPTQMEQVLANLCVNARDAIAGVGEITIETRKVTLDESFCVDHPGFNPGQYVLLKVSDNGCGMNNETLAHIFEPFFTSKDVTEGTGLGLATIYGIVKQNNGHINVSSKPGKGTSFEIYLPRHIGEAEEILAESEAKISPGNGERVLLVEDEPAIREMCQIFLESMRYEVLCAETPEAALRLAGEDNCDINLLITDVVMPGMNGRDLARALHTIHPEIKTLFMSGYTADVIAHRGVLEEEVQFIQKPFTIKDFSAKVRETLKP
jgi:two-component system sensor histidine kinase EvgS